MLHVKVRHYRGRVVRPPCGASSHPGKIRDCLACHAAQQRKYRALKPLTEEQRIKDRARSYAGVYLRRGRIERKPCADCGSADAQMHHEDYAKPLEVTWLCRRCHLARHRQHDPH